MTTFVLIHGAMHGGWCWERVASLLEAEGHRAIAPDLPGLGGDPTPHDQVKLDMTADFVADLIRAQPEPVVLVGHSMGGITISEVGERVPDRILGLVYVAAMLAPAGKCLLDVYSGENVDAADIAPDGSAVRADPEAAVATFYNRTDPETGRAASLRLTSQPLAPSHQALQLTEERYGRLPRAYIECLDDHAVPIDVQRRMQASLPCAPVLTLDTDHSPFLSAPGELTKGLIAIGETLKAGQASSGGNSVSKRR